MTVFEYIKQEETRYMTMPVPVVEGYEWLMHDHVKLTTLYLNSQYKTGKEDGKPFKNIILPKINLEHRAVEFALKEIEFFINDSDEYYKSFLVRKFHEKWALENDISDFLDKLSETYTDFGGVLVKNTKDALEVVPFQRLAFCDQTDLMSGPICEKHQYSPDQLKDMESMGWKNIDEVITLARQEKANSQTQYGPSSQIKAKTPGKYIEVYELHGTLPETFLDPNGDPDKFVRQLQVITMYQSQETGKKEGITLFAGKEAKNIYKAFKRDEIYGRALGRGGVEELFEPQVWVNYTEIQKKEMLDQASKIIYQTADQSFKAKNQTANLDNGEVIVYTEGKPLSALNNQNINVEAFEQAIQAWDTQAKEIASAQDISMGETSKTGMPFRLGALLNQENHSLHKYRKSRLGIFLTEIYRDWVIPRVKKAVAKGDKFLSCLSLDEMTELVDQVVAYEFNKTVIKKVLSGQTVNPDEAQGLLDTYKKQFFKNNKKFLTILEGELNDLPLEIEVNITDEQMDKAGRAEKLSSIFSQVTQVLTVDPNFFSNHPEMAKLFNEVIESSGLSPLNFGMKGNIPQQQLPQQQQQPQRPQPQPQIQQQPLTA